MTKIERITRNIEKNKELMSKLGKSEYYQVDAFIDDVKTYIKAIKDSRMFCVIDSVSSSGMSRIIHFHSWEKCFYRNYWGLFTALGYSEVKRSNGFRIGGCGMDMIFHTNYTNMHNFQRLGFISKKQCETLAQMTPSVF